MRVKGLLVLAATVLAVGAFIWLYERKVPTTEEAKAQSEKVFPDLKRDDVVGLEISNSHGSFTLAREGGHWLLTAPVAFPADDGAVGGLLGSLLELKRERTLKPGEVKPADYGLDQPKLRVVIMVAGGRRHALAVGNEMALGGNRAVSLGGPEVILCPGWFTRDLDKGLDDWRSRQVVEVFADQVASFTLEAGVDRVHAVRVGEQWKLLEPLQDLADREQLRNVIGDLNALRIQEFVPEGGDLKGLGLEPPKYRVSLVRSEGQEPTVLELGATRQVEGKTEVACRRNGRELFWVDDRAMTGLGKAPVRWRSIAVYPFDSWDVERATFSDTSTSLKLERKNGVWRLVAGGEADPSAVLGRLSKLAELRATDFDLVEPSGGQQGRIELELGGGAEAEKPKAVTFTFYRPLAAGGKALVKGSDRATVMGVEAAKVDEILGNLASLRPVPTPAPSPTAAAP